jgi:hypothetical protein
MLFRNDVIEMKWPKWEVIFVETAVFAAPAGPVAGRLSKTRKH